MLIEPRLSGDYTQVEKRKGAQGRRLEVGSNILVVGRWKL